MKWNPRYVAYAWAHGNTPERQLELDDANHPGGIMTGFIIWNRQRLDEFRRISPNSFIGSGLVNHTGYDAWLFGTAQWWKE